MWGFRLPGQATAGCLLWSRFYVISIGETVPNTDTLCLLATAQAAKCLPTEAMHRRREPHRRMPEIVLNSEQIASVASVTEAIFSW